MTITDHQWKSPTIWFQTQYALAFQRLLEKETTIKKNVPPPRPMTRRYHVPMRNVVPRDPNGIHPRLVIQTRNRAVYEAYEDQYRMMTFYEWLQSVTDES